MSTGHAPEASWLIRGAAALEAFVRRHRRRAVQAAVFVVVAEGVRIVVARKMGDFGAVYQALHRLVTGEPLYVGNSVSIAYVYSPLVALVLAPLGMVSAGAARFVWFLSTWGALAASWWLAARLVAHGARDTTGRRALAVAGVWGFAYDNGLIGQATPVMVALVLLAEHASRAGRARLAGLSIAAATLVKPFPALLLVSYVFRRRGVVVVWTLLFLALGLALPALWFGAGYGDVLRGWRVVNHQQQTLYAITSWSHQSISALVYRLAGRRRPRPFALDLHDPAAVAITGIVGALLAVTIWATVATRNGGSPIRRDAAYALYLLDWALLPPTAWKHYYVTLLFPAAVLARLAVEPGRWQRASQTMLATLALSEVALLAVRPPPRPFVLFEWSACVWLGLATFALLAAVALRPDDGGPVVQSSDRSRSTRTW